MIEKKIIEIWISLNFGNQKVFRKKRKKITSVHSFESNKQTQKKFIRIYFNAKFIKHRRLLSPSWFLWWKHKQTLVKFFIWPKKVIFEIVNILNLLFTSSFLSFALSFVESLVIKRFVYKLFMITKYFDFHYL